ncbi:TPA: aromatic ring-hydroxylating dioxygenase subunit alpha [Pseudomonas putida]|nr:aromatic ring-hydroxylating dioxygenase subunit alpha [Pseudomonas putida]
MKNKSMGGAQLAALLDRQVPGETLDQAFYTDDGLFQFELNAIWHREWLFAGMSCEINTAGSWFKVDIGTASVVVMRGRDGTIRAFHNTCRHRGSRLCLGDKGKTRNLICPYHQWTYDDTGALIFAREMPEDFDKAANALQQVHVRELAGYLFISLADTPDAFDTFANVVTPYLAAHELADAKVAHEMTIIEEANWKLVIENNRECYHCRSGHPELLNTIAEVEDVNDARCPPEYLPKAAADQQRWDAQGLPHRLQVNPQGWQVVRVPMYRGLSFTLDGQPASQRVMGRLPDFDVGSVRILHFPNTWNHALGDHAISFRVLPLGPQKTAVTTKWLVHKDAVEGVDYHLDNLLKVWRATNDQDKTLAENNQLGINSPAYRKGTYSPSAEYGVMAFITWYLDAMKRAGMPE